MPGALGVDRIQVNHVNILADIKTADPWGTGSSPSWLLCELLEPLGGSGRFAGLARLLGLPGGDASTLDGVVPALGADVRAAMLSGDVRLRVARACCGDHAVGALERTRADQALGVLRAESGEILGWG
jgi:hypothetical protein